jgi:hypothetical protein
MSMAYFVGNGIETTLFYPLIDLYRCKTWNQSFKDGNYFLLQKKIDNDNNSIVIKDDFLF